MTAQVDTECQNRPACEVSRGDSEAENTKVSIPTCRKGHEITGANILREGTRLRCRTCQREGQRNHYQRTTPGARRYNTGFCRRNHPLTPENALRDGRCRECARLADARRRARKRAERETSRDVSQSGAGDR